MENNKQVDIITITRLLGRIILRKKYQFLIILVLGQIFAAILYFIKEPVYKASMVGISSTLETGGLSDEVGILRSIIRERNNDMVAEKLGITPDEADKIQDIDIKYKKAAYALNDFERKFFEMNIFLKEGVDLNAVSKGIRHYLEEGEFISLKKKEIKKYLNKIIDKTSTEIAELDSMQKSVADRIADNSSGFTMMSAGLFDELVRLHEKKSHAERELAMLDEIKVVQDFTLMRSVYAPNAYKLSGFGLIFSFVLIVTIMFFTLVWGKEESV